MRMHNDGMRASEAFGKDSTGTASAVVTMLLMLGGSSCQGAEFGKGLTRPSLNIFPFLTSYIASLSARHNSTVLLRLIKSACQDSPL